MPLADVQSRSEARAVGGVNYSVMWPVAACGWLAVLLGILIVTHAHEATEQDSLNLIRALHHYDVVDDSPQPPGYPLVVAAAYLFSWIGSALSAYLVIAVILTIITIVTTALLARELFDRRAAAVAALLVGAVPLVLYYGDIVSVYPSEAALAPVVLLLAARVARRRDHWSPILLFPALALLGGFRPTGMELLLPVVLLSLAIGRPPLSRIAAGVAAGGVVVAAWAVPMLALAGWHRYWARASSLAASSSAHTSILRGATLHEAAFNAALALAGLLAVALPVFVALAVVRIPRRGGGRRDWLPWVLLATWVTPYVLVYVLVLFGKPGYAEVLAPAFACAGAGLLRRARRAVSVSAAVAIVFVVGYATLPMLPLPWRLDTLVPTARSVRVQDAEAREARVIGETCRARCAVVSLPSDRRLWFHGIEQLKPGYLPYTRIAILDQGDPVPLAQTVYWIGSDVPRAVAGTARFIENAGTWHIYRSDRLRTTEIARKLGIRISP